MDCWKVLEIEKTTDKALIKKAFYAKLPLYHPEDDPEGFQKLKAAFDEAMAYDDQTDQEEDTSEVGIWMAKVSEVYADFPKRIDIANWEDLLNDPVVVSLASNLEACHRLLVFLLDNFRLPHRVFALLEKTFNWKENRRELLEMFPANFIDFLLDMADREGLRYGLFDYEAGKDYDRFIENYFTLYNALIPPVELEKIPDIISETDALGIAHPDYTLQKIKAYMYQDKLELCCELRDSLLADYPDSRTYYVAAHIEYRQEHYDAAIAYLEQCLTLDYTEYSYYARLLIADCLVGKEMYEAALEKFKALRLEAPASDELTHRIRYVHGMLVEKLADALPDDDETKLKYIGYCVATESYDCEEIAVSIDPSRVDKLQYYRTMGELYGGLKEMKKSAQNFEAAITLLRAEQPADYTGQLCEVLADYGWAYAENDEFEKAVEIYDEAIKLDNDFLRGYYRKSYALNKLKRYRESLVCCEYVLERAPHVQAVYNKALALQGLGDYESALAAADQTIAIAPYQDAYRIKLECLDELARYDEVFSLIEVLQEKDAVSAEMLDIQARSLVKLGRNAEAAKIIAEILAQDPGNLSALVQESTIHCQNEQYDKAIAALDQIDRKKAKGHALTYAYCDVFTKMGRFDLAKQRLTELAQSKDQSVDKEDLYHRLALLADQELEKEQEQTENNRAKANTKAKGHKKGRSKKDGQPAALEYYLEILRINDAHPFANREIAKRYFQQKDYEGALPHARRQAELSKANSDGYLCADLLNLALIHSNLNQDAAEKEVLDEALLIYPYDEDINNYLGAWYVEHDEHEKAYPHLQTAMAYGNNEDYFWRNITQNLFVLGRYEEGIDVAAKAAEAHPGAAYFLYRQAWFNQMAGRFQEALRLFQKWGDNSDNQQYRQESLIKVGDCQACMKDYHKALDSYIKALSYKGKNVSLYLKTGYIYELLSDYKNARRYYSLALVGNRRDDGLHRLAMLYWKRGQKIRSWLATKRLELYLHAQGKTGDSYLLGTLYKIKGKYKQAIQCFTRKIENTKFCQSLWISGCSESYYELAEIHRMLGNKEEARFCEERAGKISQCRFDCGKGEFYS